MAWIRQKNEPEPAPPRPQTPQKAEPAARQWNAEPPAPQVKRERSMEKIVNIGQSVQIKGELTGNEDLTIEGKVDGKITLKDHALTIGANGRIKGEIFAKSVTVIGEVEGNVIADDKVEVAATGGMNGDIVSPRVVLADGARFKGSIDMEKRASTGARPGATASTSSSSSSSSTDASRPASVTAGAAPKS